MPPLTVNGILDFWQAVLDERQRQQVMTLIHCFDAATPPHTAPAHCQAVLGYAGGANATRVWSREDWLRFAHLHQFAAWVPDTNGPPEKQAREAVAEVHALGFHHGRAILCDTEDITARDWYAKWAYTVTNERYLSVDYGSLSVVLGNAAQYVWVAAWDGVADLAPGQTIVAEQYAHDIKDGDTSYDLSIVSEQLLHHAGVGPRQ